MQVTKIWLLAKLAASPHAGDAASRYRRDCPLNESANPQLSSGARFRKRKIDGGIKF